MFVHICVDWIMRIYEYMYMYAICVNMYICIQHVEFVQCSLLVTMLYAEEGSQTNLFKLMHFHHSPLHIEMLATQQF